MKVFERENQKGWYGASEKGMNFLVCAYCETLGETETLAEAVKIAEKHVAVTSDLRIHEYASGETWYLER